jgi:4'-phosphopantetheinyl transferase
MDACSLDAPRSEGTRAQPWQQGPLEAHLARGELHLWRADLDAVGEDVASLLSELERERARQIAPRRRRRRWECSRGVLRALLGRYLRSDPRALALGARGRPELADRGGPRHELCFSLAHSGQLALYALYAGERVGVDIEVARPPEARPRDHVALARRAFGAEQARRLAGLERAPREVEFLRLWTRSEAALKCVGAGMGARGGSTLDRAGWIAELDVGPRAAGAVACGHAPRSVSTWQWCG